jgi:hypothetical protein
MLTAAVKITLKDMTKLGTEGVCSFVTIITITVIGKQNVFLDFRLSPCDEY